MSVSYDRLARPESGLGRCVFAPLGENYSGHWHSQIDLAYVRRIILLYNEMFNAICLHIVSANNQRQGLPPILLAAK